MKKIIFAILASLLLFGGCSKNDGPEYDKPDNGGVDNPNEYVPDPDGTVKITMLAGDQTSLDGLYIDADNNFHGDGWMIAPLGEMKGLGNVKKIPFDGWAESVAVIPGHSYVAHNKSNNEYVRIYVMNRTDASSPDAAGGFSIKYQKPFYGANEKVEVDLPNVVSPTKGGRQLISFKNTSMIPFKVETSANWILLLPSSTREPYFLQNCIIIDCSPNGEDIDRNGTVTITNMYGEQAEIPVTQKAHKDFIEPLYDSIWFNYSDEAQQRGVMVGTDIDVNEIKVETDSDWISAAFPKIKPTPAKTVRFIDGTIARHTFLNVVAYPDLVIKVPPYMKLNESLSGKVTLSYGDTKAVIKVDQYGISFKPESTDFKFDAEENLTKYNSVSTNLRIDDLYKLKFDKIADGNTDWCDIEYYWNKRSFEISVEPNPYKSARSMDIKVFCKGVLLTTLHVSQEGGAKWGNKYYYLDRNNTTLTLFYPMQANCQVTSSAGWCKATASGAKLVIDIPKTNQNRSAVISMSGVDAKVYISQSKYAVGDTYSEGGVTGKVSKMENGEGYIYQEIKQRIAWSDEYVLTPGTTSMTDGMANTEAIKKLADWQQLYPAFAVCDALNKNGVTGWYLPAQKECPVNAVTVNGSAYDVWSSTSNAAKSAETPNGGPLNKKVKLPVTPVHKFNYNFFKK